MEINFLKGILDQKGRICTIRPVINDNRFFELSCRVNFINLKRLHKFNQCRFFLVG